MNIISFINSLRPAIPLGERKDDSGKYLGLSNAELRRLVEGKAVIINGERDWKWDEECPNLIWQLVFFPKSDKKRTTLI